MERLPPNVRRFLAFRVFFNARFYYPVLAVFFVDLGLSLDQYAILNVAWAASIVFFELPLGAVSDRMGRRPLVVAAGALMVVEMGVLSFAPTGNVTLLFWLFLVNRILSGLAEAAASGADEALAYDTLAEQGRRGDWPRALTWLQRLSAGGFVAAMLVGGAVYDADLLNGVGRFLGFDLALTPADTVRFPAYLTLGMAVGALLSALGMREPAAAEGTGRVPGVRESLSGILDAGDWIRGTRFVLAVILLFLVTDSVTRLFLTLESSYLRLVGLPAVLFGVVGAGFGGLGFVSPTIARRLLPRLSPVRNFAIVAACGLAGLAGIAVFRSWVGALFIAPLALGWHLLAFFSSQYLNDATESKRRATVLSFKNLAGNLAYGGVGVLYAVLYRSSEGGGLPEGRVLAATLPWMPIAIAAFAVPILLWARRIPDMRARSRPPRNRGRRPTTESSGRSRG